MRLLEHRGTYVLEIEGIIESITDVEGIRTNFIYLSPARLEALAKMTEWALMDKGLREMTQGELP